MVRRILAIIKQRDVSGVVLPERHRRWRYDGANVRNRCRMDVERRQFRYGRHGHRSGVGIETSRHGVVEVNIGGRWTVCSWHVDDPRRLLAIGERRRRQRSASGWRRHTGLNVGDAATLIAGVRCRRRAISVVGRT